MIKHKLVLISAASLLCLTMGACNQNNKASQSASESREASSLKKDNSKLKKQNKKKQSSSTSSSSSQNNQDAQSTSQQSNKNMTSSSPSSSQNNSDEDKLNKALNEPYKGYSSYAAYCEANGGDPEVKAETARMQHDNNVKQGIENPDGSETQNFQNWVSARDNAWDNGNDNFPAYDQNTQW